MPISKEHVQAAKSKQIIKKVWFGDEAICCMKICTNTFFLFIWTRRLPRYYRNMWLQLWWFWRASIRFIQLKISTVPGFEPNQKSQTRLQPTLTTNLDKIYYGEINRLDFSYDFFQKLDFSKICIFGTKIGIAVFRKMSDSKS